MRLNYPTQLLKRSINQQRCHCLHPGGGLMFGKANDLSPQYIDILTEHYDLIQLSYRLLPEVSLDCIIEDVYASFDAIQSQYSNCPILPLADHQVHI